MHTPEQVECKVGVINESPIRIYKCDDQLIKKHSIICPYFLDEFEVAQIIGKKVETLKAFTVAENEKRSVKRNALYKPLNVKVQKVIPIPNGDGLNPISFEIAALYWLQYAVMGNSLALQISRSIIDKSLEKIASEIFWKKTIIEKQLQIQEAVKIAKQEETIINNSKLSDKNSNRVYTLDGSIEKARIIMGIQSTVDTTRIIESGVTIKYVANQVVRITTPTIDKEMHDAIMDIASRYRQKKAQASAYTP